MALATTDDYTARYPDSLVDTSRLEILLDDASAYLLSEYAAYWGMDYMEGTHPVFDRAATAIVCEIVNRRLSGNPELVGATQYSQGAGSYTASVTYGSDGGNLGEMWLSKSQRQRLGFGSQQFLVREPYERDPVEC